MTVNFLNFIRQGEMLGSKRCNSQIDSDLEEEKRLYELLLLYLKQHTALINIDFLVTLFAWIYLKKNHFLIVTF